MTIEEINNYLQGYRDARECRQVAMLDSWYERGYSAGYWQNEAETFKSEAAKARENWANG